MSNYKNDGTGRLHHRVSIVTGSASGIGRAIALALAREGAYVVCADLVPDARSDGFEEDRDIPTHTVINNNGGKSIYQKCDMGKTEEIFTLIDVTVKVCFISLKESCHIAPLCTLILIFTPSCRNLVNLISSSITPVSGCPSATSWKRRMSSGMP